MSPCRTKTDIKPDIEHSYDSSWQDAEVSTFAIGKFCSSSPSHQLPQDNPNSRYNRSPKVSPRAKFYKGFPNSGNEIPSSWSGVTPTFETSTLNTSCNLPLTEVTPQLFLGTLENAMNEGELRANGVTHIMSVIRTLYPIAGIKYKHAPMKDFGQTDLQWVMTTFRQFIEKSQEPGKALFVHGLTGHNRSATLIIAILMRSYGKRLYEAYKMLKVKRPNIRIGEQYGRQLVSMELVLFGRISVPNDWVNIDSFEMETGELISSADNISSVSSNGPDTGWGITLTQYDISSFHSNEV